MCLHKIKREKVLTSGICYIIIQRGSFVNPTLAIFVKCRSIHARKISGCRSHLTPLGMTNRPSVRVNSLGGESS